MSCISPVAIKCKAHDAPIGAIQMVPCGKCIGCLQDRQNDWIYRIERQLRNSKHSLFVTLTYDEHNVPLAVFDGLDYQIETYSEYVKRKDFRDCVTTVNPRDLQLYFKRLRKRLGTSDLKFFACGEYGDHGKRPHYHFILMYNNPDNPAKVEKEVNDSWNKGFVTIEPVIPNRVTYVTKYIMKGEGENRFNDNQLPCFQRSSRGLGDNGFFTMNGFIIDTNLMHEPPFSKWF